MRKWVVAGLIAVCSSTSACSGTSESAPQAAATAASRLLTSRSFTFVESDMGTSPIAIGNGTLVTSGVRTQDAFLAHVVGMVEGQPTDYTVYATKTTYCHLGASLENPGCTSGDGYDNFLTFDALYYLHSIANKRSRVDEADGQYSFSGSALTTTTTPNIEERWQGSFSIEGGYITHLQYTQTGSEGAVQHVHFTATLIGKSQVIHRPPGASG